MATTQTSSPPVGSTISRAQMWLLAVVAGLAAASLYYVQPLLEGIGRQFSVGTGQVSLLVTASQVGYVAGLALLVPLGDTHNRRRLLTTLMMLASVALALTALAPTFWSLLAGLIAIGVTASSAMVAVPYAAALADASQRGRVTGSVMSGVLLGILLARTASGAIAGPTSWRVVFAVAAILSLVLAVIARRVLADDTQTKNDSPYGQVLASVLRVVRDEPVLRARLVLGALAMFGFSAMWTSIAFLLAGHYHYGETTIGLFGLVGTAGAAGAPLVGRIADRGHGQHATTAGWVLAAIGWVLLWAGATSLTALLAGLLVFDFATQALQVSNQARIYQLAPQLRGRITTAYMVTFFLGGAAGSLTSGAVYTAAGWHGVCLTGLATAALGLALWATIYRPRHQ